MRSKPNGRPLSFGRNFFLLLLTGVAGYNTYETIQLRQEVADLKQNRHFLRSAPPVTAPEALVDGPSSLLKQARKHVGDAQAMLQTKDYERARTSLMAGMRSLERANAQARAEGDVIMTQLRSAMRRLSSHPSPQDTSAENGTKHDGDVPR